MADNPQEGSVWRHYNGEEYMVVCLTNLDSDKPQYQPQVVYVGRNHRLWSRPASDWHRSFTPVLESKWNPYD